MNPYKVVHDFEKALCEYTGARYAVTTNSCTMAILLALKWHLQDISMVPMRDEFGVPCIDRTHINTPSRTYISVPQSIIHAGGWPNFIDFEWKGSYKLHPLPVYDSARRFTSGMYEANTFECVSFHASKILGDTQGGAILHDNPEADKWFRRARFDGRSEGVAPKDDHFDMIGYHCYMSPDVATRLLLKLSVLPKYNDDLPNDDYPDLSKLEIFK